MFAYRPRIRNANYMARAVQAATCPWFAGVVTTCTPCEQKFAYASPMNVPGGRPENTAIPDYRARLERTRAQAARHGFDGLYVTAGPTFAWLSGFAPYPGGWPDFLSCLVVPLDRDPVMVLSAMHAEILDREACAVDTIATYLDGDDPTAVLRDALRTCGPASVRLAVEDGIWYSDVQLAAAAAPRAELVRSPLFGDLRAVKDAAELALLRRSAACQDACFATAAELMRAGGDLSEVEVAIRSAMHAVGCDRIELLGVFGSCRPRTFRAGELIDIDFGTAACRGYTIDSSRNVFFGEPSAELIAQWELVKEAYDAAVAALRPGVSAAEVHRAGARVIEEGGHRQTWKLGHGVGLSDGHEAPWIQAGSETVLEPGMTFTIDPGFFVGRDLPLHIEDTVVLTDTGWESLNRFPQEIVSV
jgi:Xaa-Pro aminopeptidase